MDAVGGLSGISVANGAAYTLTQDEENQYLLSVDTASGERRWQTTLASAYLNGMGDGPRATPSVSDRTVYAFTGDGILAAVTADAGDVVWKVDTIKANGGKVAEYGMSCSPLVIGDSVIVTVGSPKATLVAYDKKTGQRKWTAGREDPAGYSSPLLLDINGSPQIVAFTGKSAIGVDSRSGELLWRYDFATPYNCNTACPVAVGDKILLSAGENHGSVLLKVSPDNTVREVWTALGPKAGFRSEWQTPVLHDGNLYAMDNVGSAGEITNLTCVDAKTGKTVWQQRRFGKGNHILADGKLWITTMRGELVLVKASPAGFEEVSRAKVIGETRQAPTLSNGHLYLRDGNQMVCFDVRR